VFRYADKDALIEWKVQASILKSASIFVYGGEAAVGWHLCEICPFRELVLKYRFGFVQANF